MRKFNFKSLVVSACLALLIASIGGIVAGAEEANAVKADLSISAQTLDFNDEIAIAFAIPKATYESYGGASNGLWLEVYAQDPEAVDGLEAEKVTSPVMDGNEPKIINGNYVMYVCSGFAAKELHKEVYVRFNANNGVGAVVKTGVLELTYKMLEKANEAETPDATRVGLYESVIEYHDYALQTLNNYADYKPYTYVKLSDGLIDGKWASGVYTEGTVLNVVDTVKEETVGAKLYGWSDGGETILGKNSYEVPQTALGESVHLEPLFVMSDAYYNDPGVAFNGATVGTASDLATRTYKDSEGAYHAGYSNTIVNSASTATTNYNWLSDNTVGYYSSLSYAKTASTDAPDTIYYYSVSEFDGKIVMDFNIKLSSISGGNLKLSPAVAATATATAATTELFDIMFGYNSNGLYVRTQCGTYAWKSNAAKTDEDGRTTTNNPIAANTWYNIKVELIPGEYTSGLETEDTADDVTYDAIVAAKVYLNNEEIASRGIGQSNPFTASYARDVAHLTDALAKNTNADFTTLIKSSTAKPLALSEIKFLQLRTFDSSAFGYKSGSTVTDTVSMTPVAYYAYDSLVNGATLAQTTGYGNELMISDFSGDTATLHKWNALPEGAQVGTLNNATTVNINPNTGVISTVQLAKGDDKNFVYFLFENPFYNNSAAGKTMVFEFDTAIASGDADGDGTWNEGGAVKNGVTKDFNTVDTSVLSFLRVGFTSDYNNADTEDGFKTNASMETVAAGLNHQMAGSTYHMYDALSGTGTDKQSLGTTSYGAWAHVKIEITFDENGDISKVVTSVTSNSGTTTSNTRETDGTTGTTTLWGATSGAAERQYFGLAAAHRSNNRCAINYKNFVIYTK